MSVKIYGTKKTKQIKISPYEETLTITISSGQSVAELDKDLAGRITRMLFVVPDLDDSNTAELKLQNADDENIFESGELAENTTHRLETSIDVVGTITFRVECSGAQTTSREFKIYVTMI
mgnify:CR=1 FL=1